LGDSIKAGTDIAMIGEGVAQSASAALPQPVVKAAEPSAPAGAAARSNGAPAPVAASLTDDGRVKASPVARKIAEERGIDLRQVAGSGPGGRIVKEDVEGLTPGAVPISPAAPVMPTPAPAAAPTSGPVAPAARKMPEGADIEVIELNTMRKRIAQVTVESKQWQPHFYVTTEIDVEPLLALRQQLNTGLSDEQKISVNDL
ncbi:MAG: E3 binding domain-containing protein, partial [Anaerolineae bacterium]|nr:E3 binding domain-containing protein [Anaerolineae bacterium]